MAAALDARADLVEQETDDIVARSPTRFVLDSEHLGKMTIRRPVDAIGEARVGIAVPRPALDIVEQADLPSGRQALAFAAQPFLGYEGVLWWVERFIEACQRAEMKTTGVPVVGVSVTA